jgi:hypothetical protein
MQHNKHLERLLNDLSLEELMELNDLQPEDVIIILYKLGYLLYPEDRTQADLLGPWGKT